MDKKMMDDIQEAFITECRSSGFALIKADFPLSANMQEDVLHNYVIRKYIAKEKIELTLYFDVTRKGRTDAEIEQCLRELKVKLILLLVATGFENAVELIVTKMKYKVVA